VPNPTTHIATRFCISSGIEARQAFSVSDYNIALRVSDELEGAGTMQFSNRARYRFNG
jgi:ABC-type polysaccharide/polyol phosphate transport system ATPase subunit